MLQQCLNRLFGKLSIPARLICSGPLELNPETTSRQRPCLSSNFITYLSCSYSTPNCTWSPNYSVLVSIVFNLFSFSPQSWPSSFLYLSTLIVATGLRTIQFLLPDATLSQMVKECRRLFSAFLCSKKRDQKSRLIRMCQFL
jgi:hypothetical protein